ncbi:SurA N-terminal domain-containing protein [Cohaesibacter haloalkalitolerans]|uniref:SurA N-terminal domain-containing protein n=1 Tax=Cohaesibacter haloalkalitolerans TaxID=1162980 RepID=UPI000E656CDB|nr:SurA N-terminal domain-containing protein [Cohaesibacter haloalkalitolerans]
MMEFMRSMASGFIAKILMLLLVLSFAIWGIADVFGRFGQSAIATVGDTEIDARDFQSELLLEVNSLSSRLGQRLTAAQTQAFGVPNQVLGRMINEATLNDLASTFNMGLSSTELAKRIAEEPAFQTAGKFNRNQMALVLRNAGTTEDRYVTNREELEVRRQLAQGLTGNSAISNTALKIFNDFSFEKRDIRYLALKEAGLDTIEDPSDEALKTYYEDNKVAFRAPEYRSFVVLKLEPGDIMDPSAVTDEDAKTYYESVSNRFVQPEKRQMQQILFGSKEDADAALAKIKAGASFDDIMAERNLTESDVDFGLMAKADIADPAAADAIFSLDEGAVSDVVEGQFGFLLLRNVKTVPTQTSPFEDVKDQLKAEIAGDRANGEVMSVYDNVEDMRAGGSTLEEISQKLNLKLRTVTPISKAGELEDGNKVTDLPEQEKLLTSVFDTDVDYEADPIDIGNTGFAWFRVTNIVASRDRDLDEVKDDVVKAWKENERTDRNAVLAGDILKELKAGKTLDDVATERGLTIATATDVTRQVHKDLPASAVDQAFAGPLNHMATAVDGETQYVLEVVKVTAPEFNPDALELESVKARLNENASTDLLSQLSAAILSKLGYTVNEAMLNQVVSAAR